MNVSLTSTLEELVRRKVASGLYNDASDVIREALRLMSERDQETEWLKREAAIGYAQLEADQTTEVASKEQLLELACGPDEA